MTMTSVHARVGQVVRASRRATRYLRAMGLSEKVKFRLPNYQVELSDLPDLDRGGDFLPHGYRRRETPEYYTDKPLVNRWHMRIHAQPDVYAQAGIIAKAHGATKIIDVGTGAGTKLVKLYPRFKITGIDFGPNIQMTRQHYSFGDWLEHDLSSPGPLPVDTTDAVIVCADVIEHMVDSDLLLDKLRAALGNAQAVVLSTPDREQFRGIVHLGPPDNPAHVREWTLAELARYLRSQGFRRGRLGFTRYRTWSPRRKNIIAVLEP